MAAAPWPWPGSSATPRARRWPWNGLSIAAYYSGDLDGSVRLARQAEQIPADIPGWIARNCSNFLAEVLNESGDLAEAERVCAAGLARSRDVGDLRNLAALLIRMAMLEMRSGRTADATAHLREALQISAGTGGWFGLANGLACCGHLCAATERWAEAVTVWAASAALLPYEGSANPPSVVRRRQELLLEARQALGPARTRLAEDRGAAMNWATAAEYALLLTAPAPGRWPRRRARDWEGSAPGNGNWSPWSPRAAPTPRSPPSCTSASAPSARTWTGSGTRPAAAAAPT